MRGGLVIEASESRSHPSVMFIEIATLDTNDVISVWVERTPQSVQVEFGDWITIRRGRVTLWTPWAAFHKAGAKVGVEFDIPLSRIGQDGACHPDRQRNTA